MAEEFQIITVYFLYYNVKISKTISLKLKKIKKIQKYSLTTIPNKTTISNTP